MPRVESTVVLPVDAESAFALSQSQRDVRYRWDRFVIRQELLDGAVRPAKGVRTLTRSRHRLTMISEYTSLRPPVQVGMRMVEGPWFFRTFAGGWSFADLGDGRCEATWRYTFSTAVGPLSKLADRIGEWLLGRDIDRRLDGFARGCADPELIAAARRQLGDPAD